MTTLRLHQFPYSHFNEKARWALDFKQIQHEKVNYLPGPHAGALKKLSGQTSTPVLEVDGELVSGSTEILTALEERFPEKPLFPIEATARSEALKLMAECDAGVGVSVRAATFSVLLNEGNYVAKLFGEPHSLPKRWVYQLIFPMAKSKVKHAYKTDDAAFIRQCVRNVDVALDGIASRVEATGFLVGDQFTAADLTAAALLAPALNPDHPDMQRPEPEPAGIVELTRNWRSHPAAAWVHAMYENYR